GLVVVRVVPRQHAGDESLVELLDVFEGRNRLGRIDYDLVLVVDDLAPERPQRPLAPAVGVAGGVAQREAGRRVVLLQGLAELEEAGRVLGKLPEARGLHVADAVVQAAAGRTLRNGDPAVALLAVTLGNRVPAAILRAEIFGDVGDVDQLFR